MPDLNSTTQQDFMPAKKPGILDWLRNLTPKKKVLFWAAVAIGVIAVVLIIYFALAAGEAKFHFVPQGDNWTRGRTNIANVSIEANEEIANIDGMTIIYYFNTPGTPLPAGWTVTARKADNLDGELDIDINSSIGRITVSGDVLLPKNTDMRVLIIEVFVPESAVVGDKFVIEFDAAGTNEVTVLREQESGEAVVADLGRTAEFKIIGSALTGDGIYLWPESDDKGIDETFDIELRIQAKNQDIIAVETEIKYDPVVLEIVNIEIGQEFDEQGFEPEYNRSAGTVKLLRGTYGDGISNNGTLTPSQDKKGLKGTVVLATLTFKAIEFSSGTQLSVSSAQVVKDDGLGTLVPFQLKSISFKILESKPVIKDLYIMPDKQVDEWYADVGWATNNILTTSKVYYVLKDKPDKLCMDYNYSGAYFVKDDTFSGPQHSLTIPDPDDPLLDTGKQYCVKVVATNKDGKHAEEFGEFTTETYSAELKIINLSVQPSYNSAIITWNTIGGPNYGLANTKIESCTPGDGNWSNDLNNYTLTHSIKITGLQQKRGYTCNLLSEDKDNNQVMDSIGFTTKEGQEFDANTILKVEPDRICDKWLYCRSAVQVINSQDETENLCFDVGVCDEQSDEGSCAKQIDADILDTEQEFSDPNQIKNLSGLSKVGFNWGGNQRVAGYKHYGVMETQGTDIAIPNTDFESDEIWPWQDNDNVILKVVNDPQNMTDKILQIAPDFDSDWSNASLPIGWISNEYNYAISIGIRSASSEDKNVRIQFGIDRDEDGEIDPGSYYTIINQPVSNYWQTIILSSDQSGSMFPGFLKQGEGFLNLATHKGDAEYETLYYIDNISMKSVLEVATEDYISRSCRLYPSITAPSCSYVGTAGKEYRGWQGFCVEPDPKYSNLDIEKQICLNWWPVDILPGETDVFGTDQQAGYKGRQPLYYCLESAGNYPYFREGAKASTVNPFITLLNKKLPLSIGWKHESGLLDFISVYDASDKMLSGVLYKDDIKRIDLKVVDTEESNGRRDWPLDIFSLTKENNWEIRWSNKPGVFQNRDWEEIVDTENHCSSIGKYNVFGVKAIFNKSGLFTGFQAGLCDASDKRGWLDIQVDFYLHEYCRFLAQVVTPDGRNVAWSGRVRDGGWLQENILGYEYDQDYAPYGAAVVPAPVSNPAEWEEPLYVKPADKSGSMQKPYQIRAGSPYGAFISIAGDPQGIGSTQCIAGTADRLGLQCESNIDCGYSLEGEGYGLCVGINLTDEQRIWMKGGWLLAQEKLSELFAKSFHIWQWDWERDPNDPSSGKMKYVKQDEETNWDITHRPEAEQDKPKVMNIKVRDQKSGDVIIQGPKSVILKFNASLNEEHLPMTAYRVDWNDGTAMSQVNNLKIYPRTHEDNPHVLFHTYECRDSVVRACRTDIRDSNCRNSDGDCQFIPKIQVEDNWGWCNNGYGCPGHSSSNPWAEFGGYVIVLPK